MTEKTETLFSSQKGAYSTLKSVLKQADGWALLMDSHTEKYCKTLFLDRLDFLPTLEIILEPGEENKTLNRIERIYGLLLEQKMGRNAVLVNLGGGVVSDMGGFAAATFKRGIQYINVPTTLLAMVDASLGGKTGVNFMGLKNQIGSFHHPSHVLIDEAYLDSLSAYELKSGYAEVMKHALIADVVLWQDLLKVEDLRKVSNRESIIRRAIEIKSGIVEKDPNEKGARKLLNFGHTIGHAVESYFSHIHHPISHGHAVAVGMIVEMHLASTLGLLDHAEVLPIAAYLHRVFDKVVLDQSALDYILSAALHDKKNQHGRINCTLLSSVGTGIIDQMVDPERILESLNFYTDNL